MKKLLGTLLIISMVGAGAAGCGKQPAGTDVTKTTAADVSKAAGADAQETTVTDTQESGGAADADVGKDGAGSSPIDTSQVTERTIRFGTTSADTSALVGAMKKFQESVAQKSDNKMKVEIFSGSTLGDVPQMMQNARLGAIEMCMTTTSSLVDNGAKKFTVLNLPYIFDGFEHSWKVLDGDVGEELLGSISQEGLGLVGIGYYKDGARNFFTTEKPVRKLEDLKGLKVRVQPNEMDTEMALALGANPTPISFSELYSALQSGVVEGAENPTEGFYNGKYSEICKYLTLDEHSNPPVVALFSQVVWEQLSQTERQIISESWKEAQEYNKSNAVKKEQEVLEKLKEEGVEVIEITDKDKWLEAVKPVYDKFGGEVSDLVERIEALK